MKSRLTALGYKHHSLKKPRFKQGTVATVLAECTGCLVNYIITPKHGSLQRLLMSFDLSVISVGGTGTGIATVGKTKTHTEGRA